MVRIFSILAIFIIGVILLQNKKWTNKYDALFVKYANKYGVDWKMTKAISIIESRLGDDYRVKNGLVSSDGLTYGLMQIKYTIAKFYLGSNSGDEISFRTDFEKQIEAATAFLADLKKKFNNDTHKIVISYNQGETHTKNGKDFTGNYYDKFLKYYKEIS